MKTILATLLLGLALALRSHAAFSNLSFEQATIVPHDGNFGFLDWNLAAPGWSHSSGADTGIIYYPLTHLGLSQWYLLVAAGTSGHAPLAGNYSLAFSSGYFTANGPSDFTTAYISQSGVIPFDAQSLRFLATGPFAVRINGNLLPVVSLGGNAYAANISALAGVPSVLRFENTTTLIHEEVVVDNIVFSSLPVPEPSAVALLTLGGVLVALRAARRRL
jgi:hypothetical protein